MIELIITSTNVYPPWHRRRTEVSTAIRRIGDETIVNRVPLPVVLLMSALPEMAISAPSALNKQALCPDQGSARMPAGRRPARTRNRLVAGELRL